MLQVVTGVLMSFRLELKGYYRGVTDVLEVCYGGVTWLLQSCFRGVKGVLHWFYSCVRRVLQGCFRGVTGIIQGVTGALPSLYVPYTFPLHCIFYNKKNSKYVT